MRLLLAVFLISEAHAQLLPGIDPRVLETRPVESLPPVKTADTSAAGRGAILCEKLREIRLETPGGAEVSEVVVAGVSVADDLPLPSPVTLGVRLAQWRDRPLKEGDLVAIADVILTHYDGEGYPVVLIDVPEQDLHAGTLRFVVEVGRIGNVGVARPKYGDPEAITRGLILRRGELLRREKIDSQMAWLGRTVFRRPQLFVSPGTEPATADLLIGLAEQKPWRASIGYENSGPDLLGRERFLFGVAGMTKGEHLVAWQTVLGETVSTLQAHALSWEIPFQSIHQSLELNAVYAKVNSQYQNNGLPVENVGTSWSLGATQKMALTPMGKWRQRVAAGIEVKSTDQFILFGGSSFSPGEVRLVNGTVHYGIGRDWENGGLAVEGTLVGSPGGLIDGNDDTDFQAYDPDADASYLIARLSAQGWWSPGRDWRLAFHGTSQAASSRLLPVEQFAAGGWQTVRGVAEREFFADGGWQGSLELYTPAVTLRDFSEIRFLCFIDQATLQNRGANSEYLSGAGLGVRMKVSELMDLRADYGWRIDDHGGRVHFGLQVNF